MSEKHSNLIQELLTGYSGTSLENATRKEIILLQNCLERVVSMYVELVKSGDYGSFNPEEEESIIDARRLLCRME